MFKYLRRKWMRLWSIFKDENDINEKVGNWVYLIHYYGHFN